MVVLLRSTYATFYVLRLRHLTVAIRTRAPCMCSDSYCMYTRSSDLAYGLRKFLSADCYLCGIRVLTFTACVLRCLHNIYCFFSSDFTTFGVYVLFTVVFYGVLLLPVYVF